MSSDRGTISRPISISPPPKRRRVDDKKPNDKVDPRESSQPQTECNLIQQSQLRAIAEGNHKDGKSSRGSDAPALASPVQLNFIDKLPCASNVDTLRLDNILGDPLIQECWLFNYLFDLDFVMSQFDPDIKNLVKVHVVHGSWRREDPQKLSLDEAAKRYPNVNVITAYMPEAFGTHHSKMIILFRRDDLAQIVILTGNFIQRDWSMSQAIWRSPLLPLLSKDTAVHSPTPAPVGHWSLFKRDFLAYLNAYGLKFKDLSTSLKNYDFRAIKAALVGSTPGRQNLRSTDPDTETLWGWPGLQHVLNNIESQASEIECVSEETVSKGILRDDSAHIVIQVSSVASIGEKWLSTVLFPALAACSTKHNQSSTGQSHEPGKPNFSIVFPTADTIRKSIDGYACGASIHMKTQTQAQAKQLSDIRPMLHHWAGNANPIFSSNQSYTGKVGKARRGRAAPHIKTYIRFHDSSMQHIDWGMVTSANLSTQAWGSAVSASGEVRICSYEIGVVFWPSLWDGPSDTAREVKMVPVFGSDTPAYESRRLDEKTLENKNVLVPELHAYPADRKDHGQTEERRVQETYIGWRMPYDLPLVPYGKNEMPWCASQPCKERDSLGRRWSGYGR